MPATVDLAVTLPPVPAITGFTPVSGPVGSAVTVTGSGFLGATSVSFSGVPSSFVVNSATSVTALVPTGAATGAIAVVAPGGMATSASTFFRPTRGVVGTYVGLSGTGFQRATSVAFSGISASFTVNSDNSITAQVPAGAVTGPIAVTTPAGTAVSTTLRMPGGGSSRRATVREGVEHVAVAISSNDGGSISTNLNNGGSLVDIGPPLVDLARVQ